MRGTLRHIFADLKERYGNLNYCPHTNESDLNYGRRLTLDTEFSILDILSLHIQVYLQKSFALPLIVIRTTR